MGGTIERFGPFNTKNPYFLDCIVNGVISNEGLELGQHGCWEKLALSQQTALFLHC